MASRALCHHEPCVAKVLAIVGAYLPSIVGNIVRQPMRMQRHIYSFLLSLDVLSPAITFQAVEHTDWGCLHLLPFNRNLVKPHSACDQLQLAQSLSLITAYSPSATRMLMSSEFFLASVEGKTCLKPSRHFMWLAAIPSWNILRAHGML